MRKLATGQLRRDEVVRAPQRAGDVAAGADRLFVLLCQGARVVLVRRLVDLSVADDVGLLLRAEGRRGRFGNGLRVGLDEEFALEALGLGEVAPSCELRLAESDS